MYSYFAHVTLVFFYCTLLASIPVQGMSKRLCSHIYAHHIKNHYQTISKKPLYKLVSPFLALEKINTIKQWMNQIENNGKSFLNYDDRIGISWDDYRINTTTSTPELIKVCYDFPIVTYVANKLHWPKAQSIFDYAKIAQIFLSDIIPKTLHEVKEWTPIPRELLVRTEVHRYRMTRSMNGKKNNVVWHQDPGSFYKRKANYSIILMLSDQNNPCSGWSGGEFLVKPGLPQAQTPFIKLIPRFNQAIILHNRAYSHAVTSIEAIHEKIERDLIIVELYTEEPTEEEYKLLM
jgi:hypothetical protein